MAQDCTIPCSARALVTRLQKRYFGDQTFDRLPVIGGAMLVGVISPVVLLFAPAITAIVLAGWCLFGIAVVLGQSWLGAAEPARRALPDELIRLVDDNAQRIHPPRLDSLRQRAASIGVTGRSSDVGVTHLLLDLREATGEAWRCRCPERRLPLPWA
jgi:hypothetical protein